MKGSLKLPFVAAVVLLCTGQMRVGLQVRVDAEDDGRGVVTNLASVPLTAYLIEVIREHCSPSSRYPRAYRGEDAATAPHADTLNPSHARTLALGSTYCNKTRAKVPSQAMLKAAIFEDGSSSGDAASVAVILSNRVIQLASLEQTIERLKAAAAAGREVGQPETDPHPALPCVDIPNADPAAITRATLSGSSGTSREPAARAIDSLEELRQRLLRAQPPPPRQVPIVDPGLCGAGG